jgi:hypothetical protein
MPARIREQARAMGNMLRATAPGAAGFGKAAIPDNELWPELEPEDLELGELALEEADLDEDTTLAVGELYDQLWPDGLLVPLEQCCDAGVPYCASAALPRVMNGEEVFGWGTKPGVTFGDFASLRVC